MPKNAFYVSQPAELTSSVVFASPHSGRDYPETFLKTTILDQQLIRSSEDAFVDELFQSAPDFGAPLLLAGAPRAFLDLNRSPEELDPALIHGVRGLGNNPRVASGLGVVPRVVANGRAIYSGKLAREEADRRIAGYWHPFHRQLQNLLDQAYAKFGEAILVDCHSMPHEALDGITRRGTKRPEIVLGDRFGAAAGDEIVDWIEAAFVDAGLRVVRNSPFAGAFTTQHYGRPYRGRHAIQIEIDRSLYMDEQMICPNENFARFQSILTGVIATIAAITDRRRKLAAE